MGATCARRAHRGPFPALWDPVGGRARRSPARRRGPCRRIGRRRPCPWTALDRVRGRIPRTSFAASVPLREVASLGLRLAMVRVALVACCPLGARQSFFFCGTKPRRHGGTHAGCDGGGPVHLVLTDASGRLGLGPLARRGLGSVWDWRDIHVRDLCTTTCGPCCAGRRRAEPRLVCWAPCCC